MKNILLPVRKKLYLTLIFLWKNTLSWIITAFSKNLFLI
jgi:hypothetical protein